MGNKESRVVDGSTAHQRPDSAGGSGPASPTDRQPGIVYSSSRPGRGSRPDLSFLGIGSSSHNEAPEGRRETKQEREVRKAEKERVARVKEREKSIKEEHVDGGFLVTMGVYTGHEDFSKPVVRQLMIERRIAPFWRGLDDFKEEWTEHQLVAAGRGLPIPAPDEIPTEDLTHPLSVDSPHASNHNLQNLMVPISSRSHSAASDASATLSPSHPAFSNASTSSAAPASPSHSSSPFRPRSKTLASLASAAKNPSSAEIVPREIQLPKDPYVNGQAIEVFLYKDSTECPICFLYYPPYLNKTRCCDQAICSECFVQIKRPDPHPPEHHDPSNPAPPPQDLTADAEALVSEPACCPYCQQPEFGVTYEPPPFRRGLAYANASYAVANFSSAMSSSSSLNSSAAPPLSPNSHKRRTVSISANASTVITTDKVRPDWATKLANARNHLARRAAAATALHTAAYLIGNGTTDTRGFGFTSRGRFGRSRGDNSPTTSGAATPSPIAANELGARSVSEQLSLMRREAQEPGGTRRRSRMEDLEDMMMMEAIRLSLAAEEERKRKAEREAAKDAKKKAKEDKKREKKERRVYGSGTSSASGSALSLSLPGLGRRRGNSGASNLQREVMSEDLEPSNNKGKAVDRSFTSTPNGSSPIDFARTNSSNSYGIPGARHLDASTLAAINDMHQPSPSPTAPEKPSHLRQMSNASSPASSFMESAQGSLRNGIHAHGSSSTLDSPDVSGNNINQQNGGTPDGGDSNGNASSEPMFNFQSLAAMIGKEDGEGDKEDAARHIEYLEDCGESSRHNSREDSSMTELDQSTATLKVDGTELKQSIQDANTKSSPAHLEPQRSTPEVTITPETPAAMNHGDEDGKQLGADWSGVNTQITQ